MKIFVINLLRSVDRRIFMQKQLDALGLEYEFVEAVEGSALSEETIASMCDMEAINKRPKLFSKGAIGCAMSHINIYNRIVDENIDLALILEDEMVLEKDLPMIIKEVEKTIQDNEVIMLYFQSKTICELSKVASSKVMKKYTLAYPLDMLQPRCTGAYFVTNTVAKNFSQNIMPIRVPVDDWDGLYKLGGFATWKRQVRYKLVIEMACIN